MATSDSPSVPPLEVVHTRSRPQSFSNTSAKGRKTRPSTRGSHAPQTSPEVISSLISSLSAISSPAEDFYDSLLPSPGYKPESPVKSFAKGIREETISEDIAQGTYLDTAESPIVRTSKSRTNYSPVATHKKASLPPVALIGQANVFLPEETRSIGNISIEPRKSASIISPTPNASRPSSIQSFSLREPRDRSRRLEKRSGSTLRGRVSNNVVQDEKTESEQLVEDSNVAKIAAIRATSIHAGTSPERNDLCPTVGNGFTVPSRDSSKRHSFHSTKKRKSRTKSILEEPSSQSTERPTSRKHDLPSRPSNATLNEVIGKAAILKEQMEAQHRLEIEQKFMAAQRKELRPLTSGIGSPTKISHARSATAGSDKENSDPASPFKPRSSFARSQTEPVPTTPKRPGRPPPSIADSIDDAVDEYLDDPRLSQIVKDPVTGRAIAFSEVGDPDGSVVFCCVGMGTTRYLTAFYHELALTLNLRLITPDRPGIGASEPYPIDSGTPLAWPDDVRVICGHLEIQRFSVLAHSAGAVYALATALRMPSHIRCRIHLLAPWIPPSQMVAIGIQKDESPITTLPYSQRLLRSLPTSFIRIANSSLFAVTSSSIASAKPEKTKRRRRRSANELESPKDKSALKSTRASQHFGVNYTEGLAQDAKPDIMDTTTSPQRTESLINKEAERESEYEMRLIHAIWDAATTDANPAVDLMVCLERKQQIGFRYADINKEVVIHHGSKDTRVPLENIEWLGGRMRRCEVRVLEGEGHGLMASAKVMSDVLSEISQEWDDWNAIIKSGRK